MVRVLVVEDDPGMGSVLTRGLVEGGFAVDLAATGEQGLWFAREQPYDVAVLAWGCPTPMVGACCGQFARRDTGGRCCC